MRSTESISTANSDSRVWFRAGQEPGACYSSGYTVFDEALQNGRLVCRYWNVNAQIWPEMHLHRDCCKPDQPADTFRLAINGHDLSGGFTWEGSDIIRRDPGYRRPLDDEGSTPGIHGVVRLAHGETGIEVNVHTVLNGGPFIIRWIEITNRSDQAVAVSTVSPFAGTLWHHRYEEHLPTGDSTPFEVAYCRRFEWGQEGDFWFSPLQHGKLLVDGGRKGRSGWGRPSFWARNLCNGQTFVCELAWGGNYEFELDCRLVPGVASNNSKPDHQYAELYFRMGLSGYDEAFRVLDPRETVITPAVHMGLFHADPDTIVQATHAHVRHVVIAPPIVGREVEIEANHRGYLCDRENVPQMIEDADVAAALGVEMYVVDAGWFGNPPNRWSNNVGDWHEGEWMRKGGGLKAVADHAHRRGMKFGLWVEIEAAGSNSTLRKEHPQWLLARDGQPIAGGRALDLTRSEVVDFLEHEISRLIQTYQLDMFRIDHNRCIQPAGNRIYQGFTEDLTWRYYDAFYGMFDRLRNKFPKVVFQNCASGGGRLDWGTLAHFHNTELSDWMRLPRGVKILNGITMSLPPEILLRTFGTEVPEHTLDGDIDTQLRHCFCRPIFRGIAPSQDQLTPRLRERITHYLAIFREHIRPVMLDGLVFHHTPWLPVLETTPWCVLEYASQDKKRGVAALFRTSSTPPTEYVFRPRGLQLAARYEVCIDSQDQVFRAEGSELFITGIPIRLESALKSELLIFTRVG